MVIGMIVLIAKVWMSRGARPGLSPVVIPLRRN